MAKDEPPLLEAEDYYQISTEMLDSFSKYRLPLPVFRYKEEVAQLRMFVARNQRMSNELVEEVRNMAKVGELFVSRADYPIYSKHMIKQLDLVLSDDNLKSTEIADICINALKMRIENYIEQAVKVVGERLMTDTLVFTEYIFKDHFRIKTFLNRLERTHSLSSHLVNTMIVGVWLLLQARKDENELDRKELDRFALGFLLHDVGMIKVPPFILNKTTLLLGEEKQKMEAHAIAGSKMVQKLELGWDELLSATFEHHERMDGSGYPQKLSGENISKIGRICAIADSFSAMITDRVYAKAKDELSASKELADNPKYDSRYSSLLRNALITKEIQMNPPKDPNLKESPSVE